MRSTTAGAVGGLVSGAIVGGGLTLGRDAGLIPHATLRDNTREWLDATFDTRRRLGDDGTEFAEQSAHFTTCLGLGVVYGLVRRRVKLLPGVIAGAAFGAAVYAFGVAGVLPELGVTEGEREAEPGVATQRLLAHLAFGAILGLVTERLTDRAPGRAAPPTPAADKKVEPAE